METRLADQNSPNTVSNLWYVPYFSDLRKALKKAKDLDIQSTVNISDSDEHEINMANEWYHRKGFEYFDIQNIVASKDTLPNLQALEALAKELIETLMPIWPSTAQEP
jgi:hypothetical protein